MAVGELSDPLEGLGVIVGVALRADEAPTGPECRDCCRPRPREGIDDGIAGTRVGEDHPLEEGDGLLRRVPPAVFPARRVVVLLPDVGGNLSSLERLACPDVHFQGAGNLDRLGLPAEVGPLRIHQAVLVFSRPSLLCPPAPS